jgi:hypothetical protein
VVLISVSAEVCVVAYFSVFADGIAVIDLIAVADLSSVQT